MNQDDPFFQTLEFLRKPALEQKLFRAQAKYLESRQKEDMEEIFKGLEEYSINFIKRKVKQYSMSFMNKDELKEKGHELATVLVVRYLKNPEFKVSDSFGGLLEPYIKSILFSKTAYDTRKLFSLDETPFDSSEDQMSQAMRNPLLRRAAIYEAHEIKYDDCGNDVSEAIVKMSKAILRHQSWKSSTLFTLSMHDKIKNRRRGSRAQRLQEIYDGDLLSNLDKADLAVRTLIRDGA